MPYGDMSLEQIQTLLDAGAELMSLPGVLSVRPEYAHHLRQKAAICVYVDIRARTIVDQLPSTIAGLPVLAKVEDAHASTVVEIVDLSRRIRSTSS